MFVILTIWFVFTEKIDAKLEAKLVVQALRINTLSKLTFADSKRFDALVHDVFPGVEFKDIEYESLAEAIREVCKETNLHVNEAQIKKALELYEQLSQRMGVVVVGPSGSGKSTLWKTLQKAMQKTGRVVKQYVMNPKAMPRTQLLGSIDMDTREWSDGVLTFAARQVVKEPIGVYCLPALRQRISSGECSSFFHRNTVVDCLRR